MPLTPYTEPKVLDAWLGSTAPTVPATTYLGLVLECGELSTALVAGTAYTSIACATKTVAYAIASGDIILIGAGSTSQTLEASAAASVAATSVSVDSFIANAAYAVGTPFIRCTVYATAQEPSGGSYARVSVTNNTTNWPNSTANGSGPGYIKQNGTAITFPAATAGWGTVAGFLIGDNATPGSGNLLAFGVLNASQAISSGNTPTFAADSLSVTLV